MRVAQRQFRSKYTVAIDVTNDGVVTSDGHGHSWSLWCLGKGMNKIR